MPKDYVWPKHKLNNFQEIRRIMPLSMPPIKDGFPFSLRACVFGSPHKAFSRNESRSDSHSFFIAMIYYQVTQLNYLTNPSHIFQPHCPINSHSSLLELSEAEKMPSVCFTPFALQMPGQINRAVQGQQSSVRRMGY